MLTENKNYTFLNGWIGEQLAAFWLSVNGYEVECARSQHRGTKKSVSSGDIDLIAKKENEVIYIEVKCWEKAALNPSWLVQFMLERKKLNTLFEHHVDATHYMLIFRNPGSGIFTYPNNYKFTEQLINNYDVSSDFLKKMSGRQNREFVEETLRYLIRKKIGTEVPFSVIYFKQIVKELSDLNCLGKYREVLEQELKLHFINSYAEITAGQ